MQNHVSTETIRRALAHVPAGLPRDQWARMAMALKSEFPDETGFQLFDAWSQTDPEGYDPKATRATWRSIKPSGGIGLGTLFFEAQKHGFQPNAEERRAVPLDHAALARQRAEREAAERAAAESQEVAQAAAAERARELWEKADPDAASAHPYIVRKGIKPFGARVDTETGELLVPMRDADGVLWNLQRILPQKPADGGPDKFFLKGGKVAGGLWCLLGAAEGAPVILIAEGFATAASVHEATGRPVAVAFTAQNLKKAALALRQNFPNATVAIAGDDDRETELRSGKNPGATAAAQAAARVRGFSVLPAGLSANQSDFNDLHGSRGLEAVRAQIEAALERFEVARAAPRAALATPAAPDAEAPPESCEPPAFDPFSVTEAGVYFQGRDRDGNPTKPLWVCGSLFVSARSRALDGSGWGFLLSFADGEGRPREWAAPARMLAGDGAELRARLLDMGLSISTSPAARAKLAEYIQTRRPAELATSTERCGWHPSGESGAVFVLPQRTICSPDAPGERVIFQSDAGTESNFKQRGDVAAWRERVGALCRGNSRLTFAVSAAFAAPLLRLAGVDSGGVHVRGDSSCGKTTALRVAASVFGPPAYLQRWRATANALESIAAQHCDSLLILDELAQVDPREAGEAAYMLANEQSKARATRNGGARQRLSWRLLFLSAGEVGLADHLAEAGRRPRAGQEARMVTIEADAGAGMGIFEELHGRPSAAAFANELQRAAAANYGAPGLAWLEWIATRWAELRRPLLERLASFQAALVPAGAAGQAQRVGARFALVGTAGELATEAGLTGWEPGEAEEAARVCFEAWLAARGGAGNAEVQQILRQVRRFLEANGEGRFAWWHRAADDHASKTLNRAGLRRMLGEDGQPIKNDSQFEVEFGARMPAALGESVSVEYFILREVFTNEVCAGFDPRAVAAVLLDHGCLVPDKGRRYDCKPRLPGIGLAWCYRIPPAIFELDL